MGAVCCGKSIPVPPPTAVRTKTPVVPITPEYEEPRNPTPPVYHDYSAMERFNKVGISTSDPLLLIKGYLDEPLVSLEQALKSFDGKIDQLSYSIQEAKTKCHYPSEHGLTRDESAAIYIYTMKWGNGCLYDHLQDAWESRDQAKLKPWFKYLKLFKSALDKLPDTNTEIWQGVSYDEKLKEQLSSKLLPLYSSMGSCSPSEKQLKEYLEKHVGSKMILIGYESVNGKLVTGYTASDSKEVMVWPGMKLGVSKYTVADANGSVTFHIMGSTKRADSIKPPIIQKPKHFVCQNSFCGYSCGGNHDANHCYGFTPLFHTCQHHCGPTLECSECHKHIDRLRECNKCQSRFCEKCCSK